MNVEIVLWSVFLLFFPYAAHAGAIGGDRWRPEPKGVLDSRIGRIVIRHMNLILLANGVFAASIYLVWKVVGSPYYWIPVIVGMPTIVAQFVLAGASAAQSN
jgi:hypothetical protein